MSPFLSNRMGVSCAREFPMCFHGDGGRCIDMPVSLLLGTILKLAADEWFINAFFHNLTTNFGAMTMYSNVLFL